MADVNLTVDGKKVTAPAGTLLIEACKSVGIEVPSFCYYPNLSLQGACRMCLVKIEKMPKLQTACTTVISEGMAVTTEGEEIKQARKSMLEMLLGNHPLDCPVCDAGGECELQDMTFSYGAAESKFMEAKNHKEEQQWTGYYPSPGWGFTNEPEFRANPRNPESHKRDCIPRGLPKSAACHLFRAGRSRSRTHRSSMTLFSQEPPDCELGSRSQPQSGKIDGPHGPSRKPDAYCPGGAPIFL